MKNLFVILLLLIVLSGCSKNDSINKEDNIRELQQELTSFFGYECENNVCINSFVGGESETDETHIKIDFNESKIYKKEILDSSEFNYDITYDYKTNIVTMKYKNVKYDETLDIETELKNDDDFKCNSKKENWHEANNYNTCNQLLEYSNDFKEFLISLLDSFNLTINDIK